MKNILGLDLGTNSIGWSVISGDINEEGKTQLSQIQMAGSRIIPMDAAILGDFNKGNSISQTAERTRLRGVRRLNERHLLRRERIHRILSILHFLPQHYSDELDRYGKFLKNKEPKLVWKKNETGHYEFIFQNSFQEMLTEFRQRHPELLANGEKIPYDWTIYYLRKKALHSKIEKEELAWLLLNFNQKRGYYQRGEEEEKDDKQADYYALKVIRVEDSGEKKGNDTWYNVYLENGWIYRRTSNIPLDWEGKVKDFIVTTELDKDGNPKTDKEGNIKRSFRAPKEDDWNLLKKKTESDIIKSHKTVGSYIYNSLLENPKQKIIGKLVRTIERKFYQEELRMILEKQKEFHPELQDRELYQACIEELYPINEAHRNNISARDFTYLFLDDILFYQRPLKSKKSLISNCPYEENHHTDPQTGEITIYPIKCIAKSHPLFQEFRLWQFINNLRIYKVGLKDEDVTALFLKSEDDYVALFDWLNSRKDIDQKALLKYPTFKIKGSTPQYRWNYVEDKLYPCNEVRSQMLKRLKNANIPADFLSQEKELALWHILYSVEDKNELAKALQTFAQKNSLSESFVDAFKNFPPFKKEYGSYSAKAIKKLLPLMRMGKYWEESLIDEHTRTRIDKITAGEYDEKIDNKLRERLISYTDISEFKGMPLWLACYVVYGRHSEAKNAMKWESPDDIDEYLRQFKQHSLHNPIVEQVIMETLRTVRDIWKKVDHIDEIHVELGRDMKNPADKRAELAEKSAKNENTIMRIKYLLAECMNPALHIDNVRPNSPSQQEILRIYEDNVLKGTNNIPEDIPVILKKFSESDSKKRPTFSEVQRYIHWIDQKYCSPYTGKIIPLSRLFTPDYEIEHIIPQVRYFDDSFSNKVICESAINKLKDKMLGHEFITKHAGEIVQLPLGETVKVFSTSEYEQFVREHYANDKVKMKKLLMDDIPDAFIARQLNDSRYISKLIKSLLSNIVREEGEDAETSKNVISCTGGITDRLKKDWGINDVWNRIILPRFKRLNQLSETTQYTTITNNGHEIPSLPIELQKGFNKKRIDHRHHAMDAIVIACANRNIVNYLNNESASSKGHTYKDGQQEKHIFREDLQRLICNKIPTDKNGNYKWEIKKPWETLTTDVQTALENIVVSFKQNLRVINKTTNHYTHFNNDGEKVWTKQSKGDSWAIRKPMHKDTVFGEINLRRIKTCSLHIALNKPQNIVNKEFKRKIQSLLAEGMQEKAIKKYFEEHADSWTDINLSKIEMYYFTKDTSDRFFASRKPLDTSFSKKKIEEEIADTGIQKILLRHLERCNGNPEIAFSPDGIERMNRDILLLNNNHQHQPIFKVRTYGKAEKFAIGESGNKSTKFVEAAKGTNLFYAVYENELFDKKEGILTKKREFLTIPLQTVIERQKQGLTLAPENKNSNAPLFVISPNDLVYLPTHQELEKGVINKPIDKTRIYKMVSATGNECYFVNHNVANIIIDKVEFFSKNKMGRAITGEMIKDICLPIKVNRLGEFELLVDLCRKENPITV